MEFIGKIVVLFVILGVALGKSTNSHELKRCSYGDHTCIKETINSILKENPTGWMDIGLQTLKPLIVEGISIKQDKKSPVNIDLKFTNSKVYGISDAIFYSIKGFKKDIRGPHLLKFKTHIASVLSQYVVDGRVLILPVRGDGDGNITFVNPNCKIVFKGEPAVKDGKVYLKMVNMTLNFKVDRMYTHFENLFNGDKALGDNMNRFLNENWQEIFSEMNSSINEALARVFGQVIQSVFNSRPYADFFDDGTEGNSIPNDTSKETLT